MNHFMQNPQRIFLFFSLLAIGLFFLPFTATGADIIIKYYIYSMKTPKDRDAVVKFIKQFEGVIDVETKLDRHWVYLYLEDDIMEDERFKIRIPLEKMGYPVDRWEVQLEKPDSHE
jgi:hypothetical protein